MKTLLGLIACGVALMTIDGCAAVTVDDSAMGGKGGTSFGGFGGLATAGIKGFDDDKGPIPGGDVFMDGVDMGVKARFDGNADPAAAPTVVYPLPHSLFPSNLAPVEVHLKRVNRNLDLGRITFEGPGDFKLSLYGRCAPAEQDPSGCVLSIPADVSTKLARSSERGELHTTVRLAGSASSGLGEATLEDVAWTRTPLAGGLYYWSAVPDASSPNDATKNATQIRRYDFANGTGRPQVFWQSAVDSPTVTRFVNYDPATNATDKSPHACVGCHALSPDGSKIALTYDGSLTSAWSLVDVGTRRSMVDKISDPNGYATYTTFSADGTRIINSYRGKLLMRTADPLVMDLGPLFVDDTTEAKTEAYWGGVGANVVFSSFVPDPATKVLTSDLVKFGQIWVAPSDGRTITGPASILVPRAEAKTRHYPVISADGRLVAFNESTCGGVATRNGWGDDPCDGYNDPSSRVMLIGIDGRPAPVDLARLNGEGTWTNSWPRFSPDVGSFRGKPIYWIGFSSRRPYGLRLAGSNDDSTKPQLWFGAVRPFDESGGDPSFAPIWLPNQNDDMTHPSGNHVPQWTIAVPPG